MDWTVPTQISIGQISTYHQPWLTNWGPLIICGIILHVFLFTVSLPQIPNGWSRGSVATDTYLKGNFLDDHHARRLSSGGDISEEAGRSLVEKWMRFFRALWEVFRKVFCNFFSCPAIKIGFDRSKTFWSLVLTLWQIQLCEQNPWNLQVFKPQHHQIWTWMVLSPPNDPTLSYICYTSKVSRMVFLLIPSAQPIPNFCSFSS